MLGRGSRRAADKWKSFVNDLRVDDVTELGQSTVRAVMQFERIERLRLIQLRPIEDQIPDRLRSKVQSREGHCPANLTTYAAGLFLRGTTAVQPGRHHQGSLKS